MENPPGRGRVATRRGEGPSTGPEPRPYPSSAGSNG